MTTCPTKTSLTGVTLRAPGSCAGRPVMPIGSLLSRLSPPRTDPTEPAVEPLGRKTLGAGSFAQDSPGLADPPGRAARSRSSAGSHSSPDKVWEEEARGREWSLPFRHLMDMLPIHLEVGEQHPCPRRRGCHFLGRRPVDGPAWIHHQDAVLSHSAPPPRAHLCNNHIPATAPGASAPCPDPGTTGMPLRRASWKDAGMRAPTPFRSQVS
nr:uncharacterized protein LOC120366377 [Saimiri boliviensis boliviensis]